MAVDEALLREAATERIATLRCYEWKEPTLSLGYFQKYADRLVHPASRNAAVVRRHSGGGAILHDHELTYSLVMPETHPLSAKAPSLYNAVHEVLVAVLRKFLPSHCPALALRLVEKKGISENRPEPFLCFLRRSPGDLIVQPANATGDSKIVGSAQRRNRGAVLQHGSILLSRSPYGPELAGLNDLCDTRLTTANLASELITQLPEALGVEFGERKLSAQCHAWAMTLRDEKYGNRLWTEKR